jgi:hypothetical protein
MLEYAWFRLLVRAIGVLLIGIGAPGFFAMLVNLGTYVLANGASAAGSISQGTVLTLIAHVAASCAQVAFGLYLLLGANRLIGFCIRDVLDHCTACGYDVRRVGAPNCPECGVPLHARPARTPPAASPPLP